MLDQLVGACYLVQWNNLGDLKTAPSRLKCLIDSAGSVDLGISRNIVAADKEDSVVHEDELPERNFRRRSIGCIKSQCSLFQCSHGIALLAHTLDG